MYYRYRSKKGNKGILKFITTLIILSSLSYLVYRYHSYIFFWKYSYNKLEKKVNDALKIQDHGSRKKNLSELVDLCNDFLEEKQLSPEAFLLSGKVHYYYGESFMDESFSQMFIKGKLDKYKLDNNARTEFLSAIKGIRKGIALLKSVLNQEYKLILTRALFYTDYYKESDIFKIIEDIQPSALSGNKENVRFFATLFVLNNKVDAGLDALNKFGGVNEETEGILFLAKVNNIAKKFTNSILLYKQLLNQVKDNETKKLIYVNLGEIYYNQSLYNESLEHFTLAREIDNQDNFLKIWVGKNYSALGNKTKAKAIWTEVLVSDRSNEEAKRLLGLM